MAMEIRWEDKIIEAPSKEIVWVRLSDSSYRVTIEGKNYIVDAIEGPDPSGKMLVKIAGVEREVQVLDERALLLDRMGMVSDTNLAELHLCAPMPGKVLSVQVKPGQQVEAGDAILVLEAMKMENVIKAAISGMIEDVPAKPGMAVEKGELLVEFMKPQEP